MLRRFTRSCTFPDSVAPMRRFTGSTSYPVASPFGTYFTREDWPATFDKILIANRGEIACRVMRTARHLGIKTVAVFSEVDSESQHVQMADEAILLGPAPSSESYLRGDSIIDAAKFTGAQAIHPGYGFLSENVGFCKLCKEANIEFIGPPVSAIDDMGSKSASKEIMLKAGVPVVPGYHGENQNAEFLYEEAKKCGFPVMLKAVLGGGGKGMRIVHQDNKDEFLSALESCKREAMKSFGDDRVLIERYITRPRHIEFQVFADKHGNVVHLFERDCSVQRRHQKVLEEAPAPGMTEKLRSEMGKSAVDAAKAVGYVGAGTVEFIVDADTDEYFFMEMNTRLQVEHPVTEMIMQMDLVQLQLHVAAGHKLMFTQDDIKSFGHAIEARIYSEDPRNNFLPGSGRLDYLSIPMNNSPSGVRIESGVRQGDEVSIFYDPMIAKLIVWDSDRTKALKKLKSSLMDYKIAGLPTNIEFLQAACSHHSYIDGNVDTTFIPKHRHELLPPEPLPSDEALAIAAFVMHSKQQETIDYQESFDPESPWNDVSSFRINQTPGQRFHLQCQKNDFHLKTFVQPSGVLKVLTGDKEINIQGEYLDDSEDQLRVFIDGKMSHVTASISEDENVVTIHVFENGKLHSFSIRDPINESTKGEKQEELSEGNLIAPMPGKVVKVFVKKGDRVKSGNPLVIMEAMKMEHILRAPFDGVVESIAAKDGDFIQNGKLVVSISAN